MSIDIVCKNCAHSLVCTFRDGLMEVVKTLENMEAPFDKYTNTKLVDLPFLKTRVDCKYFNKFL